MTQITSIAPKLGATLRHDAGCVAREGIHRTAPDEPFNSDSLANGLLADLPRQT